jgi:hemolysin activation/secretion protein
LLFISPVFSAPLSPADRDLIRQEQQGLLQQNQQQREELQRSVPLRQPAVTEPVTRAGPCFNIHSININDATLLSDKKTD